MLSYPEMCLSEPKYNKKIKILPGKPLPHGGFPSMNESVNVFLKMDAAQETWLHVRSHVRSVSAGAGQDSSVADVEQFVPGQIRSSSNNMSSTTDPDIMIVYHRETRI